MIPSLSAVNQKSRSDRGGEGDCDEHPARHSQLQIAADAVPASASAGQTSPEYHQCSANKGEGETPGSALAEPPSPKRWNIGVGMIAGERRAEPGSQKHADQQRHVPANLRR